MKGLEKQGAAKTAGNNPVKISPPVASTSKLDSHQLATDLQGLGFHEAKSSAEETRADGNISDDDPDLNFTRGGGLPNLNVIVTGHVDSGKSTLVGHLLYKKGTISQRMVHKFEKESNALGKGSFYLAWIMDETESERDHGVTIDVTRRVFTTPSKHITILDSPGHKDFMPNMISGCSAADVALLVVPASPGEFESCMMLNAQTREHAIILKSMGVNQVLVAVNKMDLTLPLPWSQARYNFIVENVVKLLTELSFARKAIRFVPVSGLTGENLVDMSPTVASALEWYRGGTLADAFDAYKVPPRVIDKPLRAVINSVLSLDNYGTKKSAEVEVTVLQGRLRLNRQVAIASSEIVEVKGIYVNGTPADTLFAGDQGVITFAPRYCSPANNF